MTTGTTSACSAATGSLSREQEGEVERLRSALTKINVIRNSIIGLQTINWSEHIYPLVAALEAAGLHGMGYDEARGMFGTMLERTNVAEAEVERLTAELASLRAQQPTAAIGEAQAELRAYLNNREAFSDDKIVIESRGPGPTAMLTLGHLRALSASTGSPGQAAQPGAGVPREPTEEMMDTGLYHSSHDSSWADIYTIWTQMHDRATNPTADPRPAIAPNGGESATAAREMGGDWATTLATGFRVSGELRDELAAEFRRIEAAGYTRGHIAAKPGLEALIPAVKSETASVGGRDA
jgi:hypothetical protein